MAVPSTKVYIGFTLPAGGGVSFILNDTTKGKLDSVYVLGGDVLTDVTSYVESVSIDRGKSRELDRYTAGHASITLHNDSRIFDPFDTSSIYYGNIVPRKPIAIETNGVRVFTGFIDDWDLTYDISGKSYASISAVDGFMRLSAAEIQSFTTTSQLSSARVSAILDRAEVAWPNANRSIDTGLTTLQADTVPDNTNALQYLQLVETTENGQLFMNKSGSVRFKNRAVKPPSVFTTVFTDALSGDIARTNLILNPSFEASTSNWSTFNSTLAQITTDYVYGTACGEITLSAGTNGQIYTALLSVNALANYMASSYIKIPTGSPSNSITLRLQFFDSASTSLGSNDKTVAITTGAGWSRISSSGTAPATAAYARVLIFKSGTNNVGDKIRVDGVLLEQTDSLNDYFDGSFYGAQWDGTVNASTSSIPLTSYVKYSNIGVMYGSENLYNRVVITRNGGTAQTADSTTSQNAYGVSAYSIDGVLLTSDTEALSFASYLVGLYDDPELRINEITVNLHDKSDASVGNLIGLEIGDLAQIIFTPNQVGSAINQYAMITGIKHDIGIDQHQVTFDLASTSVLNFILDSPKYGILDTNILSY
jgi:hypothetical protein